MTLVALGLYELKGLHRTVEQATNKINPLNIKDLYMKKLSELSGGELQRVAIALALSKKANLVLLVCLYLIF